MAPANRVRQAMNVGFTDLAYTYAWSFVEVLLNDLAVRHGLKASRIPSFPADASAWMKR